MRLPWSKCGCCSFDTAAVVCVYNSHLSPGANSTLSSVVTLHNSAVTGSEKRGENVILESGWGIQHWDFYWNKVCFLTLFLSAFGAPALSGFFSDISTFSARKQNTSEHVWTALLCTCKVFTKLNSAHEIWPLNEWMSRNNHSQQAQWTWLKQRHKCTQANNLMRQHKARSLPHHHLHLFCPAFMPSFFFTSFFVSPSTPIWCVWTRPLSANSPLWTPSAARLSTVSWAWLLVSGRDVAVRSPVQRAAFCRPVSSFIEGSTDKEGVTKSLFVKQ